jgi:rubrerythrin
MKKIILSLLICGLISGFSANLIFAEETTTTTIVDTTTTTVEEMSVPEALGLKKVGLLPTNPFYFLKEWGRGLKIRLTGDPVKKSEVQLQILSEKIAEAEAIAQKATKPEVLEKVFGNYEDSMDRLKIRLEGLKDTSENPNIDKLLDRISEAEVRHSEVLDKILEKAPQALIRIERVRQKINQTLPILRLKFENQEEFMERLENKLQELQPLNPAPVGEFRQLRIMETMQEQLQQVDLGNYPDHIQAKTNQLLERLGDRAQQRIRVLERQGFSTSTIENIIKALPIPTSKIPLERLPKTPPPGVATTTDSAVNKANLAPSFTPKGTKMPSLKNKAQVQIK